MTVTTAPIGALPPFPTAKSGDPLANKEVFLHLLVAQIKNQNPLNPTEGTEFLAQLAQFSGLEQLIEMRQTLDAIRQSLAVGAEAGAGG